jgi:hypothetical protein
VQTGDVTLATGAGSHSVRVRLSDCIDPADLPVDPAATFCAANEFQLNGRWFYKTKFSPMQFNWRKCVYVPPDDKLSMKLSSPAT